MRAVLTDFPQLRPRAPCVLIGGTNGKGTTAGFTSSLLSHFAALKVGLYTSPHVARFCERVQVSHATLDDAALLKSWQEMELLLTPRLRAQLSFFECVTLLAFYVFNSMTTDINVLEVGLGGTWDAVNVCDPLAAVIVAIGHDHQQYLGNTYAAILADKMGITRPQRPFFWGRQGSGADDPQVQRTLQEIVRREQLVLFSAGSEFKLDETNTIHVNLPTLPTITATLPCSLQPRPRWLQHNFCLAFALSWWLLHRLKQPAQHFARAVSSSTAELLPTSLPARFQLRRVRHRHTGQIRQLLLDACHNYDGALTFTKEIAARFGVLPGMFSLLDDKDIASIVPLLARQLQPLAIFAVDNKRSMQRTHLPAAWQHCWHDDIVDAWQHITAVTDTRPLVVCGSFYGLGAALALLNSQHEWELW